MFSAIRSNVFALVLLCLCLNLVLADPLAYRVHKRDAPTTPSNTATPPSSTKGSAPTGTTSGDNGGSSTTNTPSPTGNSTSISTSASSTIDSTSVIPAGAPTPTSLLNYTGYNFTLTPHELPIEPAVTPGFAVAGVILLVTGVGYALVGIKNKWLHIYLSAAYLASIAVTVLILYVMNPPISNAIQGAYVVAAVMTGIILGGAAIIFTEMTEGLGCLFGGFCFSMWLLVLQPGGLLKTTGGKSIFIAAFTIAGYSLSFSHYTRPYALIGCISFGGATAIIIGIDCFSRAGLKEFWAYLWALNTNLFPLGATSYPVTRGIKVELAAIIIIFLAGVISQMKLWKVIKERRERRATELLQDERNMEQEEENVGRRVEQSNAEDRDQWEAVYGDKDAPKSAKPRDSGVADMDSQRRGATSTVTSSRRSADDEIEMSQIPSPSTTAAGLVMAKGSEGVTIRVARDPEPAQELDEEGNPIEDKRLSRLSKNSGEEEKVWVIGTDGEARLERRPSQKKSNRNSARFSNPATSPVPNVVPLPFKVPEGEDDDRRSSMAVSVADEDPETYKRHSRHFSAGSRLLRKLSKNSRRGSRHFAMGPSTEDLVQVREIEDDRASSLAATMDGMSDDEEERSKRSSFPLSPDTAEAARIEKDFAHYDSEPPAIEPTTIAHPESTSVVAGKSEATGAEAEKSEGKGKDVLEKSEEPNTPRSLTSSTDPKPVSGPVPSSQPPQESNDKPAPSVESAESRPRSLTKDRLPRPLSKVVMSYRTNEWAKHLSNAEAPEPEELKLTEHLVEEQVITSRKEQPAPVNVDELQQTPENALPPPAPRSASQMSNHPVPASQAPNHPRSNSAMSNKYVPGPLRSDSVTSFQVPESGLSRTMSQQSLVSSGRGHGIRTASLAMVPQSIVESPIEEQSSDAPAPPPRNSARLPPSTHQNAFGSSGTLIGKRNSMILNKSLYGTPTGSNQDVSGYPSQQLQSIPASRNSSDRGSIYNYDIYSGNFPPVEEDDSMSLSARRKLIRQSSLNQITAPIPQPLQQTPIPFDSHQPKRNSSVPTPQVREQQLASWRASVHYDLQSQAVPAHTIERQRSALWQGRQEDEQRKAMEERMKFERDSAFDERMRRGDMLDAHREALRRMQAAANKHAQ